MTFPNRENCIHAGVCKYDDAMCPMECGHFIDREIEKKAEKWDKLIELYGHDEAYKNIAVVIGLIDALTGKEPI